MVIKRKLHYAQFGWPLSGLDISRGYNAGKDENCFAQEKLILVVKSTQPKILESSNEQNMTSGVQNIF